MSPPMRLSVLCFSAALAVGACAKRVGPETSSETRALEREPKARAVLELADLEVTNPSKFARPQTSLFVSFYDLGLSEGDARAPALSVRGPRGVLPSQSVDRDANGVDDGVVTLLDLAPAESVALKISVDPEAPRNFPALTAAEISHKVGGEWKPREKNPSLFEYVGGNFQSVDQFTPPIQHTDHSNLIRYEGPGIESDKVGYRIYLDARNGFDIFGKKTTEPVLARVGLDGYESYHHMADWGMDILKVGQSLGAGGFGFWNGKQVELLSNVQGWNVSILDRGPIQAGFQIAYNGWQVAGRRIDTRAHFEMVGGSRRVQVRLQLSEPLPELAVGFVKHPNTELVRGSIDITGKAYTFIGSWGAQSLSGDELGMAVLFERAALAKTDAKTSELPLLEDPANYSTLLEPSGGSLSYHFLAAWQGEPGGIENKDEFVRYLQREAEQLTVEPRQRLQTSLSRQTKQFPLTANSARDWAKKLADSELIRKTLTYRFDGWDESRGRKPKFEYDVVGLQPMAYEELHQIAPDPRYADVIEQVTGSYVTVDGNIREYDENDYNMDSIAPGRNLLSLYQATRHEKYRKAASLLRRQLSLQPRTSEGAFWHKKRYPHQLWLDGVYMAMPFLARYATMFETGESLAASLDDVVKEFTLSRQHLRDASTGLYFHAWDERKEQVWADPATGRSKHYWGRGLGWFSMALVDVLDYIPENDTRHRAPLLEMIAELAPALLRYRDAGTHTWWQIMDTPSATGNYRESTASAMFTYFLAKAVRKGYLPASYRDAAVSSYQAVIDEFVTVHADGQISMTNQCLVAGLGYGRDGSYDYYMSEPIWKNDPKGNGPFILAGVEVYRLLQG
jgi:unsaturated rhamnogalacturonyl hydrolase